MNQNDGVIAYVRSGIVASAKEPDCSEGNCLVLNIEESCVVICSYRPTGFPNPANYLNSLARILKNTPQNTIILTGDININILPGNVSVSGASYISLMVYYGLVQGIDKPTRLESCIDHFMVKTKTAAVDVEPYWPDLCAKALEGVNVRDLITNIGSGVGAVPAVGGAPTAASAVAPAAELAKEEKKEEEPEESDDDMGFGLFD
ncbi:unnamed protein product [Parnassius mnemosyne]|uniref:Large ribosomal subunit protein P1 n=1 Tax=Parnassius mnemosyne TaxID=213953 RepID=A0AAV1KEF3_9NEOP